MDSLKILSFGGISNTNPPRSIRNNDLADAVDVDINDAGNILERLGASAQPILTLPVAAAYTAHNGTTYLVSEGGLNRLNPDLSLTPIAPCRASAFADQEDYLFTNDGLMVYGDQAHSLDIPAALPPQVSVIPGNWPAGRYSVVATNSNASGLMTAASQLISLDLPENSALAIQPTPVAGYTAQVWLTEAYGDEKTGGEVFYNSVDGSVLPELFLNADKFPGGYGIEWFDSRLFLAQHHAQHSVIYYSHRHHYHLFDLAENYFIIPDVIYDMRATATALVLAGESGIYAYDGQSLSILADYGCPDGRPIAKLPDQDALLIHSKRGVCQFPNFKNLTEKKVSLPAGSQCSTHIVHQRGMQQFVALNNGGDAFNIHY